MAGRAKPKPLTPGRKAIRAAIDEALRAASALDRVSAGAGDELRHEVAVSIRAVVARRIRSSENGAVRNPNRSTY